MIHSKNMLKIDSKPFIGYNPVVILIFIALICISYHWLDIPIARTFSCLPLPYIIDKSAYFLASFGLSSYYFISLPIIAIIAFQLNKNHIARACTFLFICVLVSGIACSILKIIFGRARPDELFSASVYGFYWLKLNSYYWSFPSGHATTFCTIMLGLCLIKPRWFTTFITLAIFISATRVFLAKHYLSDIIAGFYLALVCVHEVRAFYTRKGYTFYKSAPLLEKK